MAKKKVFSIGSALTQGLEETIGSAQGYSGELRVDVIPLSKLELDPENPRDLLLSFDDVRHGVSASDPERVRKKNEIESLLSIAESIKSQGIINPVTVYKYGEKYRLIAGERRTLASLLAGKSDIQARILDDKPNELKISLLQWIENIERSDLTLWERLTNLKKIIHANARVKNIKSDEVTITDISHLIGCVKSHAMNYKAVLNAEDDIKNLIRQNKIRSLEKAALLAEINSKEVRADAINACVNGATLQQLKSYASQSSKSTQLKSIENRGRQTTAIHFGATKNVNVAKTIFNAVLNNNELAHLSAQFKTVDWNNPRAVADAFKRLLHVLEEIHV